MDEKKVPQLKDEVGKKFKLAGVAHAGQVRYKGKNIDLAKLDLKQAEELAKDEKFPYLVEIKEGSTGSSSQLGNDLKK